MYGGMTDEKNEKRFGKKNSTHGVHGKTDPVLKQRKEK